MSLLELQRASAGYGGQPVLEGISLKIERGEKVALVGESGAGKSTLLGLLYERLNGSASLVPQELGLVKTLSVFRPRNISAFGWPLASMPWGVWLMLIWPSNC